jgi:hypothetical protein
MRCMEEYENSHLLLEQVDVRSWWGLKTCCMPRSDGCVVVNSCTEDMNEWKPRINKQYLTESVSNKS